MTEPATSPLASIAQVLSAADKIVVMTGAGMSAESGIPTFRGTKSGLWAQFDPEQLATGGAFQEGQGSGLGVVSVADGAGGAGAGRMPGIRRSPNSGASNPAWWS